MRAARLDQDLRQMADLVMDEHERRRRNPGAADWLLHGSGIAIAYNWPDGDDTATALVVTVWRE
jgi:hypothetical protein